MYHVPIKTKRHVSYFRIIYKIKNLNLNYWPWVPRILHKGPVIHPFDVQSVVHNPPSVYYTLYTKGMCCTGFSLDYYQWVPRTALVKWLVVVYIEPSKTYKSRWLSCKRAIKWTVSRAPTPLLTCRYVPEPSRFWHITTCLQGLQCGCIWVIWVST